MIFALLLIGCDLTGEAVVMKPALLILVKYLTRAKKPLINQVRPAASQMPQTPKTGNRPRRMGKPILPMTSTTPLLKEKPASPMPLSTPRQT